MVSTKQASLKVGRYYAQKAVLSQQRYGSLYSDFENIKNSFRYLLEYRDIESGLLLSNASGALYRAFRFEKEYSERNKQLLELARESKDQRLLMKALFSYGSSIAGLVADQAEGKENIYAALRVYQEGLSIIGAGMEGDWFRGARARIELLEELANYQSENTEQRLLEALEAWELIGESMWKTLIAPGISVLYEPLINTDDGKPRMRVEDNNIVIEQENTTDRAAAREFFHNLFERAGIYEQKDLLWDNYITAMNIKARLLHKLGKIRAKGRNSLEWYRESLAAYRKAIEKDQKSYTSANCIGNCGYLLREMAEYPSEDGQELLEEALNYFQLAADYYQDNPDKLCFWQLHHRLPAILSMLVYTADRLPYLTKAYSYVAEALMIADSASLDHHIDMARSGIAKLEQACKLFHFDEEFKKWHENLDELTGEAFHNKDTRLDEIPDHVFFIWNRMARCTTKEEMVSTLASFAEIIQLTPIEWFHTVFQNVSGKSRSQEELAKLGQTFTLIVYTQRYDPALLLSDRIMLLIDDVLKICTTRDPSQKYAIANQNKSLVEDELLDFVMEYLRSTKPQYSSLFAMHEILTSICKEHGFDAGFQKFIRAHQYDRFITNLYDAKYPLAKLALLKTKHKNILHDDAVKVIIDLLAAVHSEDIENISKMRNLVRLASEIGVDRAVASIFPEIQKTPILTELVEAWLALADIDSQVWLLEHYSEMLLSDEALRVIEEHLETSHPQPLSLHLLLIHVDFLKDCRENGIEIASKNRKRQIMILDSINLASAELMYRFIVQNEADFREASAAGLISVVSERMARAYQDEPDRVAYVNTRLNLLRRGIRSLLD